MAQTDTERNGIKYYIGNDGQEREVFWQTCRKCGDRYQSFYDLKVGCPDCKGKARKGGWKSATEIMAYMDAEIKSESDYDEFA